MAHILTLPVKKPRLYTRQQILSCIPKNECNSIKNSILKSMNPLMQNNEPVKNSAKNSKTPLTQEQVNAIKALFIKQF